MAHHEDSHDDHGHDMTEGNRQYYPSGWHLPLIGLFVVAFFISLGAGALLGISGTDKWGKHEVCHDQACDGHCGMDHADACCTDGNCDKCKEHKGTDAHSDIPAPGHDKQLDVMDSTANAAVTDSLHQTDTSKAPETGHEGHAH
jgi:hypothetical protein